MTIADLLEPLDRYNMKYVKIHVEDDIYIFNLQHDADSYDRLLRHFGDCQVSEWRADFGDSLYVKV